MKLQILILSAAMTPLWLHAIAPEQVCVENYYRELNRYANNPSDTEAKNRLKDMFSDKEGLLYNDIRNRIEGDVQTRVHFANLATYIGWLWLERDVKLHFETSDYEIKYTKKPGYQTGNQNVAFVTVTKNVTGTGGIRFSTREMFQIENSKIVQIDTLGHAGHHFLSALEYYERKQYAKAYEMFTQEAEDRQDALSAYWLSIMLLKEQGCKHINKKVRYAKALFWLSKIGNREDADRILNQLQVRCRPHTEDCDRPVNDGLISAINQKGLYGFIDEQGKVVIPYDYAYAYNFRGGYAVVVSSTGRAGVINTTGRTVIPCSFDSICYSEDGDFFDVTKGKTAERIRKPNKTKN